MLSLERDAQEINWSLGTYKTAEEVKAAFGLKTDLLPAAGVGAIQPSPWKEQATRVYSMALLLLAGLGFLFLGITVAGGKKLHEESVTIPPTVTVGAPESAHFAGPIFVPSRGNLEITVQAPVDNSWLYLDGALINEETGEIDELDLEVSYYHGSDSDGSWTEGGTQARRYVGSVAPGRYALRLEPQWDPAHKPGGYELRVRSRVPRFYQALLAALAIGLWPLLVAWRQMRFEAERWSESDHPWGGESE
jgi:hypothetical protein